MPKPQIVSEVDNREKISNFQTHRSRTIAICSHLLPEDFVVQPTVDVSPPKWHLAHTTWFFETFLLKPFFEGYHVFHSDFNFLFNSYYNSVGDRVLRADRGNMSRPLVAEIYDYRAYVDSAIESFLALSPMTKAQEDILELGLQHEMQHQELLLTDIKFILGTNPLFPVYDSNANIDQIAITSNGCQSIAEGLYEVGYAGTDFCFDNELGRHKVFLHAFEISKALVTCGEYIEFIEAGGYKQFKYWHAEAWDWIQSNHISAPMYMHKIGGQWMHYTLAGFAKVNPNNAVLHVSYFEAAAFAAWKGMRLPTEFEWEIASTQFDWGQAWEWTNSAYLPYPGYKTAEGALGEYNGKFMINQMVLRGGSRATALGHTRKSYRNFFHPQLQWQYAGIRLAK